MFQNEILSACLKGPNVEVILISGFMTSEIRMTSNNVFLELIHISEITNSEIRITLIKIKVLLPGWQTSRI